MENSNSTKEIKSSPTNKKRKGLFPRLSLKKTLELPIAINTIGQGEPVRRLKVFDHLGKSAGSGPSRTLVTVSGMYGLTNGGFQAEYLSLTDLGQKIVKSDDLSLIYETLFKNEIFAKFIEYWKEKTFPEDDIASDWLVRTFSLVPEDAKSFWDVIKENIRDYRLTQQLSGKQVIISKEVALEDYDQTIVPSENKPIIEERDSKLLETSMDMESKKLAAIQAIDIDLENGGKARIVVPSYKEITKADVKRMKTQIDIFSNFIDQAK